MISGLPISTAAPIERCLREILSCDRPEERLAELDGAFAALFWDGRRRRLIVVTDFLGLQPLYIGRTADRLLLASEMKGIAAALPCIEMDAAGWGAFAGMGHFLGESTSIDGVRRAPAASIIAWDDEGRVVDERRYWRFPGDGPLRVDTRAIVDALRQEIRAYARYHEPGTVLLSGGFDSRLLLMLLRSMGYAPNALAISHPDERFDADGRFALEVAQAVGVPCRLEQPPTDFYSSDAYIRYLALNEVANPSLGLFIARVAGFLRPELGAVWEGVSPGYALAFPRIPKPDLSMYVRCRRQPAKSPSFEALRLLFRSGGEMCEAFERQLTEEVAASPPGDSGLLQFEARHQMRNRMGHNPLKVYSNDVLCFTPGATREFWSIAAAIPYANKWNFALYFQIFREHFPEALRIPFCSSGRLWSYTRPSSWHYYAAQLFPPPGAQFAGHLLRWFRGAALPSVARRALEQIDPEHPDLNFASVVRLQQNGPRSAAERSAATLLFYWKAWRDVMEGRLRCSDMELDEAAA